MYYDDFKFWRFIKDLPDDAIQSFISQADVFIKKRHPYAALMFSTDRNGKTTHLGIYDCKLLLNERHNFDSNNQFAPQLLGERMPFNDDWNAHYKIRYIDNLYTTLAFAIINRELRASA